MICKTCRHGIRFHRALRGPFGMLFVFFASMTAPRAQTVLDLVHYALDIGEVEGLDVTPDGSLVLGTGPIPMPELGNGSEAFHSEMALSLFAGEAGVRLGDLPTIQLGRGEVTDAVIPPNREYLVVNVRDDDLHDRNQLLLTRPGGGLIDRVNLPDSADGIALSPDGRSIVVAGEKYEAVDLFTVVRRETAGPRSRDLRLELTATIGRAAFDAFFVGEEARLESEDLEPESVTFTPDGALAFVSLQEQSSIAVIDMETFTLVNVVHLPFGFLVDVSDDGEEPQLETVGVAPDGMGVSPSGDFLIAANEADGDYPHLAGISVVDLRNGASTIPEPVTHCIFDVDPTLLDGSGLTSCPHLAPGEEPSPDDTAAIRALPRLDPNAAKIVARADGLVAVINIERAPEDEDRGSALFLDVTDVLNGALPPVLDRISVGVNPGARPEGLKTSNGGRFIWIGLQRDGGTVARFELAN